jgi:hypothetical protein
MGDSVSSGLHLKKNKHHHHHGALNKSAMDVYKGKRNSNTHTNNNNHQHHNKQNIFGFPNDNQIMTKNASIDSFNQH